MMLKKLLRQTNDPDLEEGLRETRPFFWFLVLVLVFLYGISVYSDPQLQLPPRLIPYSLLFIVHIALHWYMPRLVREYYQLPFYLVVQISLAFVLILFSRQQGVLVGLYMALAGETIGILEELRRGLIALVGYLGLTAVTYGLLWGWSGITGWMAGALAMLLFVLIYVLLFLRQMNAREEAQQLLAELKQAHSQLAEYAHQVETLTLQTERQRMARELHDTLAQGLAGLVLQLEALEANLERDNPAAAAQIAARAKERARTALADARRAIDDLRAIDLTATDAIEREVERFRAATGLSCELTMPPGLGVSAENRVHLVRFVSEGLANAARHAQADAVQVHIVREMDRLRAEVSDDGRGFNNDDRLPHGHFGLIGLRERARLAGGTFAVRSTPGAGTTLQLTIPLAAAPSPRPQSSPEDA